MAPLIFTELTTVGELRQDPVIGPLFPYLIWDPTGTGGGNLADDSVTLADIQKKTPTWGACDMAYGLNALKSAAELLEGESGGVLLPVYSEQEMSEDPGKCPVRLIHFPARTPDGRRESAPKRTAILAAGGAYGAVCSLCEAFPVAAKLSELGVEVFCLNYRVGAQKNKETGAPEALFPKPMEDLAAAYRTLEARSEELGISMEHYAVGGFSAGGHLAACFGTQELGLRRYDARRDDARRDDSCTDGSHRYGFRAPELLMLAYPLINVNRTVSAYPEPVRNFLLSAYFGLGYTEETCRPYNIDLVVDPGYPPVYLIQAVDDNTVPLWNSSEFYERLVENGVPCRYEQAASGGHGFGLGTGTPAEGWVARAVKLWDEVGKG